MRVILSFILMVLTLPALAQNSVLRQGNKAYDEGKYGRAFELYGKAAGKTPVQSSYNSGVALYKLQDYEAAANTFAATLNEVQEKDKYSLSQNTLYNLGNAAYKAGDREAAKQAMRAAVLHNLKDKDAKLNLQFILKEDKAQKDSNQQKENPENNQDNNEQDKQSQNRQNQDRQQKQQQEEQKQEEQNKDAAAKEEAANILQMAQEHKQDLPKIGARDNEIEKDW